jgi:ubiquinone/menaquinone biosynthesis C-methylase UbiE
MEETMTAFAPARSSEDQFNRQATHYDQQWNRWNEESLGWMLRRAHAGPEDVILDVATGTGFTALAFAPLVTSVTGLDVSGGMLDQARRRAEADGLSNVEWREGRAELLPFEEKSFSVVTCRIAAHHFLDVVSFLKESHRVLRPGGRFLLADTIVPLDSELDRWQNTIEKVRDPSHVRNYTESEWLDMVEDAGLSVQDFSSTGGHIRLGMRDWIRKSGCAPAQTEEVIRLFEIASERAMDAFEIETKPDGDITFAWSRLVLLGVKE